MQKKHFLSGKQNRVTNRGETHKFKHLKIDFQSCVSLISVQLTAAAPAPSKVRKKFPFFLFESEEKLMSTKCFIRQNNHFIQNSELRINDEVLQKVIL